ncbi:IS66 family insertion sequence element accessory protein TnpA (plasmid) [Methylomonas sp. 2BW1-5-20]|uniref:IS66 family insertion sequence element accessory protein TnpA n=1 Tax=Methylomonas sp. 2BW1-5-20 TaxID=3376686 RepID=UPI00404FD65C
MAITSKWRHHIEAWQCSGLSQAEYCAEQQINVRTFTARLSDYRKLSATASSSLIKAAASGWSQGPFARPSNMTSPSGGTFRPAAARWK